MFKTRKIGNITIRVPYNVIMNMNVHGSPMSSKLIEGVTSNESNRC